MKKKTLIGIATCFLAVATFVNLKISSNNGDDIISLANIEQNAMACQEMGGMSGYIGLMENCYFLEYYLDGEEWVEIEIIGCEDAMATCVII